MTETTFKAVEDLKVYRRLCELHLQVCTLTAKWPREEVYELGSQVRRSSNSAPAQLAEKNDDRHIRNKVEGVNRARGETAETIHHLFIAHMKGYLDETTYATLRSYYKECIRMLNGLEKKLEQKLPSSDQRWNTLKEPSALYENRNEYAGYPDTEHSSPSSLKPETLPLPRNPLPSFLTPET